MDFGEGLKIMLDFLDFFSVKAFPTDIWKYANFISTQNCHLFEYKTDIAKSLTSHGT
jgi:hypothetical protein